MRGWCRKEHSLNSHALHSHRRTQMHLACPHCWLQEVADDHGKRQAREKFQQIRTAYDVLRDPERRAAYDRGEVVEM